MGMQNLADEKGEKKSMKHGNSLGVDRDEYRGWLRHWRQGTARDCKADDQMTVAKEKERLGNRLRQ